MTVDELLKPRYKVIADWPKCPFDMGMILLQDKSTVGEVWVLDSELGLSMKDRNFFYGDINKYPHLFKPLQWWEDRRPEDMPEYVKNEIFQDIVKKVDSWYSKEDHYGFMTNVGFCLTKGYEPATEQEYLNSIKQGV